METTEIKARLKKIFIFFLACYFICSCSIYKAQADENDTATIENILPNAGTTSSSRDAFDLDGVKTGSNTLLQTIALIMVLQLLVIHKLVMHAVKLIQVS